ncbi:MAG: hypothetical protein ACI8UO_003651 [Verrucomicrobiales bacterium]|jgi:hypothetical protein
MNVRRLLPILFLFLFSGALEAQTGEKIPGGSYFFDTENSLKPLVTAKGLGVNQSSLDGLKECLVVLACSGKYRGKTPAQLLAVALSIDPEFEPAYTANIESKFGRQPPPIESKFTDEQAAEQLLATTYALGGKARSPKAKLLVSMLLDACRDVHSGNQKLKRTHAAYRRQNPAPPWPRLVLKSLKSRSDGRVTVRTGDEPGNDFDGLALRLPELETDTVFMIRIGKESTLPELNRLTARLNPTRERLDRNERIVFDPSHPKSNNAGLPEVVNYLSIRHGDWLKTGRIEFGYNSVAKNEDGISSSLACALLVEGLIEGMPLADGVCCIGTLNSDGSVQPIKGIVERLREAEKNGVRVAIIPEANRYALTDLALLGEARVLANMQVFAVENFEAAWRVASSERPSEIENAINDFARLQANFDKAKVMDVVRSPKGKALVSKIVKLAPDHASAEVMQQAVNGTLPKTLSLNGSLEKLFSGYSDLIEALNADDRHVDRISAVLADFRRYNSRVEPRTQELSTALTQISSQLMALFRDGTSRENAKRVTSQHAKTLGAAMLKLSDDPEVIEDLGF